MRSRDVADDGGSAAEDGISDVSATPQAGATVEQQPLLKIVKGDPTPEELAALVTVVSAMAAGAQSATPERPRSAWAAPHRKLRAIHRHGPGAWRDHPR